LYFYRKKGFKQYNNLKRPKQNPDSAGFKKKGGNYSPPLALT